MQGRRRKPQNNKQFGVQPGTAAAREACEDEQPKGSGSSRCCGKAGLQWRKACWREAYNRVVKGRAADAAERPGCSRGRGVGGRLKTPKNGGIQPGKAVCACEDEQPHRGVAAADTAAQDERFWVQPKMASGSTGSLRGRAAISGSGSSKCCEKAGLQQGKVRRRKAPVTKQ